MKFCEKCGHQLVDEAIVCVNCGCAISNCNSNHGVEPSAVKEKKENALVAFNFVSSIFIVLCLFFAFISIALAYVYATAELTGSYTYRINVNVRFWLNDSGAILAFLCSLGSFGFGITSLVIALAKKVESDKLFNSILRLIVGILLVVLSIVLLSNC